jgi:hypothetical protein
LPKRPNDYGKPLHAQGRLKKGPGIITVLYDSARDLEAYAHSESAQWCKDDQAEVAAPYLERAKRLRQLARALKVSLFPGNDAHTLKALQSGTRAF